MTTLSETQAGGGQIGLQVAASGWKKVLKFGDGVWPPEPPRAWIPEWVTIPDPTVPAPRVSRFVPRPPPGPPPGYKAPPQPYPSTQPPPPKARPTSPSASSSAGPSPPPQAAPKPAAKPMTRRETPATEYVPPLTPSNVITYCRVWMDYTGTQVRSILNVHIGNDTEFALSHVQGPMANGAQSTWRQYLRRVATYTCLCFGLANAREIGESSYPYSDMEWLRIYNAASKRGGLVHQNYYLSVGSMTVMVVKNDDAQATDRTYDKWKRGLMSGIGGTIVDRPSVRKEKDELAGKFRYGKTILVTDLNYKCHPNSKGTTNIQYGLDELGYVVTVIDINSFKSVTRAQKFLDAVEHLTKDVMPDIATEENVTIHFYRERLRRVLRKKAAVILDLHSFTSADLDLHTFTSADLNLDLDLHTFTPADLDRHSFTSADLDLHTFTPADLDLHTFTPADLDLHTLTPADLDLHTFTPADLDLHTFTPADLDLHTLTSADLDLHTLTPADLDLHTLTSADLHLHTLTSADLDLHTLTSADRDLHTFTPSHEMDVGRQKLR